MDDTKLVQCIVTVRRIPTICYSQKIQISIWWDFKIEDAYNQPIHATVLSFKYSQVREYLNTWVSVKFIYYGTDDIEYEYIKIKIFDSSGIYMPLVILKGTFRKTDAEKHHVMVTIFKKYLSSIHHWIRLEYFWASNPPWINCILRQFPPNKYQLSLLYLFKSG